MNKYIYIGFLFLLLGCQKEGIVSFDQEKDCIQFNYDPKEDQMVLEYDFAFQTVVGEDEWGYQLIFIWEIRFSGILFLCFCH